MYGCTVHARRDDDGLGREDDGQAKASRFRAIRKNTSERVLNANALVNKGERQSGGE